MAASKNGSSGSGNSWALVVGASTTVGEQFARQLGARGLNVALVARSADKLAAIAAEIEAAGGVSTRVIAMDLTKDSAIDELVATTADLSVEYLVVNANLHKVNAFHLMPLEHKQTMLRMNLEMPVLLTHHYGAAMVERGRGSILYVNALNALSPLEIDAVFQATKAGLRLFAESLWLEYHKAGVHVGTAMVNGIEGSASYEAKLSLARRKFIKSIGMSMSPASIVEQLLERMDRGKVAPIADNAMKTNRIMMKAGDLLRFLGGKWSMKVASAYYTSLLDGDEVLAVLDRASGKPSAKS